MTPEQQRRAGLLAQRPTLAGRLVNDPMWAMVGQAAQNIGAANRGTEPTTSPMQAYQQHIANKTRQQIQEQQLQQQDPFFKYEQAKARGYIPADMSYLDFQASANRPRGPTSNMQDIAELARLRRMSKDPSLSDAERTEYEFLANTMQESIARSQMYTGPAGATGVRGAGGTVTDITTPEEMTDWEAREKAMLQGVEKSKDVFAQYETAQTAIRNMNEAIAAIDAGAQTGPIMRQLPTLNAASVALENARNRMGLDIVGQGSFGALSESELEFALTTAIPDKMEPQELRDWLVRKRDAQQKLAQELLESAMFLNGGGTLAQLYEMKRGKQGGGGEGGADDAGTIPSR